MSMVSETHVPSGDTSDTSRVIGWSMTHNAGAWVGYVVADHLMFISRQTAEGTITNTVHRYDTPTLAQREAARQVGIEEHLGFTIDNPPVSVARHQVAGWINLILRARHESEASGDYAARAVQTVLAEGEPV